MYRTAYDRMFELLDYILQYGTEPLTLTEWGRGVGLRRTPYLAKLAQRLVDYGAVDVIEDYAAVKGLSTRGYMPAQRPAEFFADLAETLLGAAEAQIGVYDND